VLSQLGHLLLGASRGRSQRPREHQRDPAQQRRQDCPDHRQLPTQADQHHRADRQRHQAVQRGDQRRANQADHQRDVVEEERHRAGAVLAVRKGHRQQLAVHEQAVAQTARELLDQVGPQHAGHQPGRAREQPHPGVAGHQRRQQLRPAWQDDIVDQPFLQQRHHERQRCADQREQRHRHPDAPRRPIADDKG
jgi:hypothetical protein